jgi:hypothetical protein
VMNRSVAYNSILWPSRWPTRPSSGSVPYTQR